MKIQKIVKILTLSVTQFCYVMPLNAQYHAYFYNSSNVNSKIDVKQDVTVSGNVNSRSTVTNIDYGAIAQANAQREANRIELLKFENSKKKEEALAIAADPMNAFYYGTDGHSFAQLKNVRSAGLKTNNVYWKIPSEFLFTKVGDPLTYRNISYNGVVTELILYGYICRPQEALNRRLNLSLEDVNFIKSLKNPEEAAKAADLKIVDSLNYADGVYFKQVRRAKVWGNDGYRRTTAGEDEYEIFINDSYYSKDSYGISFWCVVSYRGDKEKVNFEELEGRRFYLQRLVEEIIATASFVEGPLRY